MFMRRRRPLARAAMIGGTAYVAGRAGQRSAERESSEDARLAQLESEQQAPPAPAGGTDIASKLTELKQLADQGVLTPDEFETAKQKLLAG
jgi:Short C-terminal domain